MHSDNNAVTPAGAMTCADVAPNSGEEHQLNLELIEPTTQGAPTPDEHIAPPIDEGAIDPKVSDDKRATQQQTMDAVAAIWDKFKDLCFERVGVLDAFVTAFRDGALLDGQQTEARREAHNMAGSLGSVGFPEGSNITRQMEHILQGEAPISPDEFVRLSELVASLKEEVGYSPPEFGTETSR